MPERASRHERLRILLAFACIWFIWGSTFLAIRYAIVDIPPLLMCGLRLVVAAVLLLGYAIATGAAWPRGREWRDAALVGLLLPGIGNVAVTIGVAHVPSGLVALLVATIPLWMALLGSFGPNAAPPGRQAMLGLVIGFVGIVLLLGPGVAGGHQAPIQPGWALVPVLGSLSWAWGSLWSRRAVMPRSPLMSTAVGLAAAGVAVLLVSAGTGDLGRWSFAATRAPAWAALAYLAVFGSVIGFGAYLHLLRHVSPPIVATYAFVNPIVAMALGWAIGGESLGPRTLTAAAVVLAAVVLITTARPAPRGVSAPVGAGAVPARRA
ncbi:MAG TPA: EamA family transporter [Candidatus Eisenbacteria bacterium]